MRQHYTRTWRETFFFAGGHKHRDINEQCSKEQALKQGKKDSVQGVLNPMLETASAILFPISNWAIG